MGEAEGLRALLGRVSGADGPDRALDLALVIAFGQPQAYFAQFDRDIDGHAWAGWSDVDGPEFFIGEDRWAGGGRWWIAPHLTADFTAADALLTRLGLVWSKFFDNRVCVRSAETNAVYRPEGATLPLRLVAGALMHRIDAAEAEPPPARGGGPAVRVSRDGVAWGRRVPAA